MLFVESAPVLIQDYAENMTDEAFKRFCAANPDLRIEMDKDKNLIVMAPTFSQTGRYNAKLLTSVENWSEATNLGYAFDSSTGFRLPNGAKRSPDVSWITKERWEALSEDEKEDYAPICPDFTIELRSKTDRLKRIQAKMEEYLENGCRLGWLIDPVEQQVFIYRLNGSIEIINGFDKQLSGEDVLPDFVFDLNILKK
jgi:Uma2 family endonuclease